MDELPAFEEAEMTDINFEYRYEDLNDKWIDGSNTVKFVKLGIVKEIKKAGENGNVSDSIIVSLSIPAPSGSFTREERQKISLTSLVAYVYLSTAAKVEPVDNSPVFGVPGDYTQIRKYKVTAADGKTSKIWTIRVNPLPVINQYEGDYHATGFFDHPTAPRALDLDKYYSSLDATTITGAHSDLGGAGYTTNIKVNSDNTCTVTQYAGGDLIGEMTPGEENKYDPATKTFTLHYRYMGGGGYRTISETLTLK
ncbi:DUF5018-related domain-containing protein [Gaoshiqia sp. Z1-71]|uniref:DUF5018-related domain-containing protein n=1 Tax=Gaoshiqia hydrogeniformans TaxID=3290090 RepID=UPI003BF7EA0A